jgi:hypothetical protein
MTSSPDPELGLGRQAPTAERLIEGQTAGELRMALTAQDIFVETVRALPPSERLRLAALILQDLAQSEVAVVNRSDTWTEQDQADLTALSLQYAAAIYPEDQDLV